MVNRQQLRKELAYGTLKQIAERAGVNQASVSRYFGGRINSEKIENAALEMVLESKQKKAAILSQIKELNNQ